MIFQIAGLLILAAFYGCYFAKMAAQKRKGITTDQMGKGKTGTARAIEIAMKTVTFLVPLVEIASILLDASALPAGVRWAGAMIGALGVAVFVSSVVTMRDNWRAGVAETDETELVTGGIYRFSRNPAFLGFDLVYIGILLMFWNVPLLAASALAGLMLHVQIVYVEEAFLRSTFGGEYAAYQKKVRRYFGRRRVGGEGRSSSRVCRGRRTKNT